MRKNRGDSDLRNEESGFRFGSKFVFYAQLKTVYVPKNDDYNAVAVAVG